MKRTLSSTWFGSRRSLLQGAGVALGGLLIPNGLGAVARRLEAVPPQDDLVCAETAQHILDLAATAEAVALTCYYWAIAGETSFFRRLSDDFQLYLRAMLAEEHAHYVLLTGKGATPVATSFFVPANSLGFDDFSRFLATINSIETTLIGLYLVAARRFGELGQGELAALCGQIAGVEAEHRVMGREMSLTPPDPRNDLCFERAAFTCLSQARNALAPFLSGDTAPLRLPSADEVAAAVGDVAIVPGAPAQPAVCADAIAALLNTAAVAEAVGITFYESVVRAGFFSADDQRQWYLQAALDEERNHLAFLLANGAAAPPTQFFFPAQSFQELPVFLEVLDTLENLFIGAYLVAMQQFVQLDQPLLAQIAGQILGVEAEHRVLGRVIAKQNPPHDRCLEQADYTCLANITSALAPFVDGDATHSLATLLPDAAAITAAVGRFGCTAVPLATNRPSPVYLPVVVR